MGIAIHNTVDRCLDWAHTRLPGPSRLIQVVSAVSAVVFAAMTTYAIKIHAPICYIGCFAVGVTASSIDFLAARNLRSAKTGDDGASQQEIVRLTEEKKLAVNELNASQEKIRDLQLHIGALQEVKRDLDAQLTEEKRQALVFQEQKGELELQVREMTSAKKGLDAKLKDLEKAKKKLADDFVQQGITLADLGVKLRSETESKKGFESQYRSEVSKNADLQRDFAALQKEKERLEGKIKRVKNKKTNESEPPLPSMAAIAGTPPSEKR